LKSGFEIALTNEPPELLRMWKINSSAFQRNPLLWKKRLYGAWNRKNQVLFSSFFCI